jgi:hypothetical protein
MGMTYACGVTRVTVLTSLSCKEALWDGNQGICSEERHKAEAATKTKNQAARILSLALFLQQS